MESVPYFLPSKEEAKEIKAGNKSLIDRFYLQNLPKIRVCANAYCRRLKFNRIPLRYDLEDYIQESYLHFSELNFDSIGLFARSLAQCFSMYNFGGKRKYDQMRGRYAIDEEIYLLDVVMPSGEGTYGDFIPSNELVMLEPGFSISDKLYAYLSSFLNTQCQRELFDYLFWTGLSKVEIANLLNKNLCTVRCSRDRIFRKFRKRQDEIRRFLDEIGYADSKGVPA